jgi:hypothetical protein
MYMFCWVSPRRQIKFCRRFGTIYQVNLQRHDVAYEVWVMRGKCVINICTVSLLVPDFVTHISKMLIYKTYLKNHRLKVAYQLSPSSRNVLQKLSRNIPTFMQTESLLWFHNGSPYSSLLSQVNPILLSYILETHSETVRPHTLKFLKWS